MKTFLEVAQKYAVPYPTLEKKEVVWDVCWSYEGCSFQHPTSKAGRLQSLLSSGDPIPGLHWRAGAALHFMFVGDKQEKVISPLLRDTVGLVKNSGSNGKQHYKHTSSETQTHSQ